MAVVRFLHILSVVSLAVLHASLDALPVNALALERGHVARGLGHVHADIAKRRDSSPTCRPRPTSASPKAATPAPSVPSSSSSSQPASSTTSSQPPATNTPTSSGGSKILLPWNNNQIPSLKNFITSQTQTIYNWGLDIPSHSILGASEAAYNSMEFVPSIANADGPGKLAAAVAARKPRHIRGFNEPEISGQASMSVSEAHTLWMKYVARFANDGIQLLAPAVTTGSAGLDWLDSFMTMCDGQCGISLIDLHFYVIEASEATSVLNEVHGKYNLNIWITEFGCMDYSGQNRGCSSDTFNTLYSTIMSFVMDTEWIEKIGWFGMFTADELPNGVDHTNAMIYCPGTITVGQADCTPNALGYAFTHGRTTP